MRRKKTFRGQTLVEFALIFPIMLMVTYGLIELGRFMFVYASVSAAAREGARYGSAVGISENGVPYFQDCQGIEDAVHRVSWFVTVTNIDIQYDYGDPATTFATCPPPDSAISTEQGTRIHVTVTAQYHPFFFFNSSFDITADSAHTIVRSVPVEP